MEQCGNGARCFARFVRHKGLTNKNVIVVETCAGNMTLHLLENEQVRVDMGVPQLQPAKIPFDAPQQASRYEIDVAGKTWQVGAVSMGNPHVVVAVNDIQQAPVTTLGPLLESHPRFPNRVNVGFMQRLSPQHIKLRVYERGAAETFACGSGACAAVVSGRMRGWLDESVTVSLPGGDLMIRWPGEGQSVEMSGPAVIVFEGSMVL